MNETTTILIVLLSSWFLSGLLGTVISIINDMRGQEFNENYFKDQGAAPYVILSLGYFTLIFSICYFIHDWMRKRKPITKFLYKIANIGLSKKEDSSIKSEE